MLYCLWCRLYIMGRLLIGFSWRWVGVGYMCKERERVGLLTLLCSFLPRKWRGYRENGWFLRHFFFIPTICVSFSTMISSRLSCIFCRVTFDILLLFKIC
ncbi:hypothetical protein Hanom_Chr08g00733571 [Helianthus anomalus]